MNDIDVTVYFNEHRLAALDEILNGQGRTIEGVLRKCFEETYASLVPEEKREEIEALIRQKEAKAQREAETTSIQCHWNACVENVSKKSKG